MTGLRYVYGVVPATAAPRIDRDGVRGIDERPVRTIVGGALAAVTSDVDEDAYGTDALNERVRDLEWLTPRAAAHQAVNARLLEIADAVVPLAFGALYRDDDRVRDMLRDGGASLSMRVKALTGRAEWVVTVTRAQDRAPEGDDQVRELEREIATSTPGRAFLLDKRRTTVARSANERADHAAEERALEALTGLAERTYREPVAKGGDDVVVVRVSLLAARASADRVDERIAAIADDLAGDGYTVRASGPWPAYRFGSLT